MGSSWRNHISVGVKNSVPVDGNLLFLRNGKHENPKLIIPVYAIFCSIIPILQYPTIPIIRSLKYAKILAISINDSNMKFQIRYDYTDTFLI